MFALFPYSVLQILNFYFILFLSLFVSFLSLCLSSSVFSSFHSSGLPLLCFQTLFFRSPLHFYFLLFPVSSFVLFLFVPFPYLCALVPVFSPPFTLLVSYCLLCFQTLFFRSPLHFYFLLFPVSSFVLFLFVPFPYLCASVPVFSPPFTLLVSHSHLNCLILPSFLSASFLSSTLCLYHVFFSFLAVCCCCI